MHTRLGYFVGINPAGKREEVALCGYEGRTLHGEFGFNLTLSEAQEAEILAAPKEGGYFKKKDFPWLYAKD